MNDKGNDMFADDCESLLRILIDDGPKTMDQLSEATKKPQWDLNEILTHLLLAGRVRPFTGRQKNRKATFYEYKVKP